MRRVHGITMSITLIVLAGLAVGASCIPTPPVETRFLVTNLSRDYYAALQMRAHVDEGEPNEYVGLPLLPPGGLWRGDFAEYLGTGRPAALDFRLFLYRRVDSDTPIGLDPTEEVERTPVVAGQVQGIPADDGTPLRSWTITHFDAPEGIGRVKFAQDSEVDTLIRSLGLFDNPDAVWEIDGVAEELADVPPPDLAPAEPIAGVVRTSDGAGVEGIGVLIRSRFRVRLSDDDPDNDPDVGWSDPIAVAVTDADGRFRFDRPVGAYQLEVFADGWLFRPAVLDLETPLEDIVVIAEPQ